ncbi:MAG: hypothetical protein ACLFVR_08295 [Thiohalospira sp.]
MVKLKLYSCIIGFFLFVAGVFAQQQDEYPGLNDLKTAYNNFMQKNYSDAYSYFNQMLKIYPKDPIYNYYTGICLLHLENNPDKALNILRYAATQDVPDDVYFYLGLAYHRNYQFDEAIKNYEWFEKRVTKKQINDYALENYKAMARNGSYLIKYGKKYSVYSRESISKDNFYKQYQFNDLDGKFVDRDDFFGWEKDSLAGSTVLFVPNELERNEVLFFAAKNKTRGDYDLFRITKLTDTTWSQPENLGDIINTPFDENYPFIHSDGTTLFFASKGHYSMGGYDVYKSSWDWSRQTWSESENIGFPVNSPFDDILYVPSANNKLALVSSNRACGTNEYTVYKIDPEYYTPYIELETQEKIKQLAQLEVNATLDARKQKPKVAESKKTESFIKPSINKNFINKTQYDSLMNLAMSYQLKADSLRWVIDDRRKQFDHTPDGQERAKLSNKIIELEQQVYNTQKKADNCYHQVREIEQQNIALKNLTYGFASNDESQQTVSQFSKKETIDEKQQNLEYNEDSLSKLQYFTRGDEEKEINFDLGLNIKIPSRYNLSNPIPVNEDLPNGIIYMIQLGAFSSSKNPSVFKGLEPLTAIKKPNSDIRKYYAGKFRTIKDAEKNLPKVKSKGFSDAFIVAFQDGKIIPVNQAVKLESKEPFTNYSTQSSSKEKDEKNEGAENLSIIYTINFVLMIEDSTLLNKIKDIVPETKDLYTENQNSQQIITIKSFNNFDEAFALKDKIESIVNKEVEVHAYFAEHQIPLDQAIKMTQ